MLSRKIAWMALSAIACVALSLPSCKGGVANEEIGKEDSNQLIAFAQGEVLLALAPGSTPIGRAACLQNNLVCSGDRGELALALLKALGTKESETALLDLVRYRLDAGLGEEYSAAVVDLGESASKYLRQTDVGRLHAKCLKEVKELSAAYNKILGPLPPQDICRTPDQMRAEIFSLSAS